MSGYIKKLYIRIHSQNPFTIMIETQCIKGLILKYKIDYIV
jgi:hypothetical protein